MLFRLPSSLLNMMCHFGFYKTAKQIRISSEVVSLPFTRTAKVDRYLSGIPVDFVAYNVSTGDVGSYSAKRLAPVKLQNTEDGPVLPVIVLGVDVQWLPGTT